MTELERRAMLGDRQAQEECTRRGIVLACPKCYGSVSVIHTEHKENCMVATFKCKECGLKSTLAKTSGKGKSILDQWNTRPAPPIGRCKDCEHYTLLGHCKIHSQEPDEYGPGAYVEMLHDDFCSYFEPKGGEENEAG